MTLPNGNQNQNQDPIPGQTSGTGAVGEYRRSGHRRRRPPAYLTVAWAPPAVAWVAPMTASRSDRAGRRLSSKTSTSRSPAVDDRDQTWPDRRSAGLGHPARPPRRQAANGIISDFAGRFATSRPRAPGSAWVGVWTWATSS